MPLNYIMANGPKNIEPQSGAIPFAPEWGFMPGTLTYYANLNHYENIFALLLKTEDYVPLSCFFSSK